MNEQQVQDSFYAWVKKHMGETTVIFADESGKRPALPYIMINKTGSREVRQHEQIVEYDPVYSPNEQPDTGGHYPPVTATPVIETEWDFSVHSYATTKAGAAQLLRPLRSAAKLTQRLEPMYPSLIVHDISRLREVPEMVNNKPEPRANCDIFVRGLVKDGFVIDTISVTSVQIGTI